MVTCFALTVSLSLFTFPSTYNCVTCGTRYCSSKCLNTHTDTRLEDYCMDVMQLYIEMGVCCLLKRNYGQS